MTAIARVKMRWSGFIGGPGYSIFHFRDFDWDTEGEPTTAQCQAAVDRVDTFATALVGVIPYQTSLTVMSDVEIITAEDGVMTDVRGTVPAAAHNSTGSLGQVFAGPVGAVINWKTGGVRNGRRIHGRTFLVPLNSIVYQSDGTLTSGTITTIQAAATALANPAGAPDLGVWARPSAPGATDGEWSVVTSSNVPDLAAVLRSRRD